MTVPSVPGDDRGLTLGVGLFETVLFVDGVPRLWEAHVDRLQRGCGELGLPSPPRAALDEAAARAVMEASASRGRAAVRITWTGGGGARGLAHPPDPKPRLMAAAAVAPEPPSAITLVTSRIRRNPSSPTSRLKTLSYLDNVMARSEAVAAGAYEALCLDTRGHVSCAAAGNLFWQEDGRLCTPARSCGVLDGVMRGEVMRLAPGFGFGVMQVEAEPERLRHAATAFVTNSLIGCVPILSLDGQPLPAPDEDLRALMRRAGG